MSNMVEYTFSAFGQTCTVKVRENDFGVIYEKGDAMSRANSEFLRKLPEFIADSQGTWQEVDRYSFRWVRGDFSN